MGNVTWGKATMPDMHFVILIGGPGRFIDCDPRHDKTWLNYIVPIQLAAEKDLYGKEPNEKVHWFVFEPAYLNRWTDDSEITLYERVTGGLVDDELHSLRKKAAEKVIKKGATSYIHRLQQLAAVKNIIYHGLKAPEDFWRELEKFPDASISRVWYSGHASPEGLMLSLAHDDACAAVSTTVIRVAHIAVNKSRVERKIDTSTNKPSKFYGCGTRDFAEEWHKTFGVPTAGAENSVTFSVIANPGNNILTRIETTPTRQGPTGWTNFP